MEPGCPRLHAAVGNGGPARSSSLEICPRKRSYTVSRFRLTQSHLRGWRWPTQSPGVVIGRPEFLQVLPPTKLTTQYQFPRASLNISFPVYKMGSSILQKGTYRGNYLHFFKNH